MHTFSHDLNLCVVTFTDVLSQDDNQTVINFPEKPSWYGISFHETYIGGMSSPLQPPRLEADTFLHQGSVDTVTYRAITW